MSQNVSDQLLQILKTVGVKRVYGVTGDALNFFVTAITQDKDVEWIGFKHEENAAFAAYGDAESSGNLAVCAGTVGPGALHLINGLYNAKKERTPVVAITGQIPEAKRGTNYFQEVDLSKMFDDVCSYQAIIRNAEDAPRVIQRALQIAMNERTTVRIELSADIAGMKAVAQDFVHPIFKSDATLVPGDDSVHKAAELINKAKTVGILGGHGCRNAREEVLQLAQLIKAPITHTLKASDIFDNDTPQVVGLTGLLGNPSGYNAVNKCDLLLMLGTDFPYSEFLPHDIQIIQVDSRAENIGNRTDVILGVHGDIKAFIQKLLPLVNEKHDNVFLEKLQTVFQQWRKDKAEEASPKRDKQPLHPQIFAAMINQHAANDAVFTIETGTSAIWAAHHISFHNQRRVFGSFNHGTMAVGFPSAMGAQFAFPGREVWTISGDGAFNMCMQDFITAVRYQLPLKILLLNNHQLGFVKLEMEEVGLAPTLEALKEVNFNFADYAKLCGGEGVRVEKAEDIEAAILQAKASTKPFIIDAVVSSGEISLPPKITYEQAKGFGVSKLKEIWQVVTGDKEQLDNIKKELDAFFDKRDVK